MNIATIEANFSFAAWEAQNSDGEARYKKMSERHPSFDAVYEAREANLAKFGEEATMAYIAAGVPMNIAEKAGMEFRTIAEATEMLTDGIKPYIAPNYHGDGGGFFNAD